MGLDVRTGGTGYSSGRQYTTQNGVRVFEDIDGPKTSSGSGSSSSSKYDPLAERQLTKAEGYGDRQGEIAERMSRMADHIGDPEAAAGQASADVAGSYDASIGAQRRHLQRFGVNPTSGRYAGQERAMAQARAAAQAGAMTKSRRDAYKEGLMAQGSALSGFGQAIQSRLGIFGGYDVMGTNEGALAGLQSGYGGGGGSGSGGRSSAERRAGLNYRVDHNRLGNIWGQRMDARKADARKRRIQRENQQNQQRWAGDAINDA
jgi:hypothetical protein